MTVYTFPSVIVFREATGNCPVCGRRSKRRAKFEHTVNPFNRHPDGSVKTREEVAADVRHEADYWDPDFTHRGCRS